MKGFLDDDTLSDEVFRFRLEYPRGKVVYQNILRALASIMFQWLSFRGILPTARSFDIHWLS